MPAGCPQAPADPDEARALAGEFFQRAVAQDEAGADADAMALYACCYHVVPHPNTLYNLALAAERADDVRTAQHALERYLEEAPNALNRDEAEALLATVRERAAALPPDEPEIEPQLPDLPPGTGPGETGTPTGPNPPVAVVPEPTTTTTTAEASSGALGLAGWITFGAGAAIAIGGAALVGVAAGEADAVENSAAGTAWTDVAPRLDNFEIYQPTGLALLAVGGAALVAGAVLLILDAGAETDAPAPVVAPVVTADAFGLGLAGRF